MPVESAADRAAFVNPDEFGAVASYTPTGGGSAVQLSGIYDDAFFRIVTEFEGGMASSQPMFLCRSSDLPPGAAVEDAIVVTHPITAAQIPYIVADIQPDGTGMTRLILKLPES